MAAANELLVITDTIISVLVLLFSRETRATNVFQIMRLKSCKEIEIKMDRLLRAGNVLRRKRISTNAPKLMLIIRKVISHTKISLLKLNFFSQFDHRISEGSGALEILMLDPLNSKESLCGNSLWKISFVIWPRNFHGFCILFRNSVCWLES